MSKSEKIFVRPNKDEIVFFEGTREAIPAEGAEVPPSTFYRRMILDGSLQTGKNSKKNQSKKGA